MLSRNHRVLPPAYQRICGYSGPLHVFISVKRSFAWTLKHIDSFLMLKKPLTPRPFYPTPPRRAFLVETDASDVAVSAVIAYKLEEGREDASRAICKPDDKSRE